MLHGLHDGDDIGLHHALDLGEVLQHHLGAVLRRRAIELRHELMCSATSGALAGRISSMKR
jgi:hypothetical protein